MHKKKSSGQVMKNNQILKLYLYKLFFTVFIKKKMKNEID